MFLADASLTGRGRKLAIAWGPAAPGRKPAGGSQDAESPCGIREGVSTSGSVSPPTPPQASTRPPPALNPALIL